MKKILKFLLIFLVIVCIIIFFPFFPNKETVDHSCLVDIRLPCVQKTVWHSVFYELFMKNANQPDY